MTGQQVIWALVKIAVMIGFLFTMGAVLTWVDRRQSAMIQDRIGPNRAVVSIFGIKLRLGGLLHTAADGVKFFFKEDFMPPNADKLLFSLAPILAMMPVLALVAVIPFGDVVDPRYFLSREVCGPGLQVLAGQCVDAAKNVVASAHPITIWPWIPRLGAPPLADNPIELMVAPLNIGVLFVFALAGQGIVGAAIAGWSSDNKFSLMGALRAASQMVSYEVTMGMSLVGAMMLYGTVRLDDMVRWQGENTWGIFVQPLAFCLFFVAAVAESKRIPFDLPEAESELVSGYFTEYSGMKFGMFYFAEYMEIVTSSMLLVTIFLGGWQMPWLHRDGITVQFGAADPWLHVLMPHIWVTILQVASFFGKTLAMCFIQAFIRWSLPRFRYDQLMKLGWKVLLPASLANVFVTGCVLLGVDHASLSVQGGLKVASDVTQAFLFVGIVLVVLMMIIGMFRGNVRKRWITGSSARLAAAAGGSKETPMQA